MNILLWIVFGALAGWIATLISSTARSQGFLGNFLIGIIGAFLGGLVFSFFGGEGVTGFNFYSLLVAVVGSIITLWIYNAIRK